MNRVPRAWVEVLPYDTIIDPSDGAQVLMLPAVPGMEERLGRGPAGELRRFPAALQALPVLVLEADLADALLTLHRSFYIDVIGEG